MTEARKPDMLANHALPLGQLEPIAFQKFVYGVLLVVGPLNGFTVRGSPSEPADSGFDVYGIEVEDSRKNVCVQCKRYNSKLNISDIVIELAKVAMNSALEQSEVSRHITVTSGAVSESLQKLLRECEWLRLREKVKKAVVNLKALQSLRNKVIEAGHDTEVIINTFFDKLHQLAVWSSSDFTVQAVRVWSKLGDLIDKFFTLERYLIEYPRPDFDEPGYLSSILSNPQDDMVHLLVGRSSLPFNISLESQSNPKASHIHDSLSCERNSNSITSESESFLERINRLSIGHVLLIAGKGGQGKTTSLLQAREELAKIRILDSSCALPIFIDLRFYSGDLDVLIEKALGIHYGHWLSLPGNFFLLFDEFNSLSHADVTHFVDELGTLVKDRRAIAVIAVKQTGIGYPIVIGYLTNVVELKQLGYQQIIDIALAGLLQSARETVRTQFLEFIRLHGLRALSTPYIVHAAVAQFLDTGAIPQDASELIDGLVIRRIKRNRERVENCDKKILDVPDGSVQRIGQLIAFDLRIANCKNFFTVDELQYTIQHVTAQLEAEATYGTRDLSDKDIQNLARHYELLEFDSEGRAVMPHDVTADFLAASDLSMRWSEYADVLYRTRLMDDAWVFASSMISNEDSVQFLESVSSASLTLASKCAIWMNTCAQENLEKSIYAEWQSGTDYGIALSSESMAILGTEACIKMLWHGVNDFPEADSHHYQAKRGLALTGDIRFLKKVLQEADRMASSMFAKFTGGEIALWELAPPTIRVRLARERLESVDPKKGVLLSVQTLTWFGDALKDVPLIVSALKRLNRLHQYLQGCVYLSAFDSTTAIKMLEEACSEVRPVDIPTCYECLNYVGNPPNLDDLLPYILNDEIPGFNSEDETGLHDLLIARPHPKRG